MTGTGIFTSASVTEGHPDKLCDQISDAIVDAYLTDDPQARVVAEGAVARGILFLAVRASGGSGIDVTSVARGVIAGAGYQQEADGFSAQRCTITTTLSRMEAAAPVRLRGGDREDPIERVAAEQQATLFGYACEETATALPAPLWYSHKIARELTSARRDGRVAALAPDGQAQVAVAYEDGRPVRLHAITIVTATQPDAVVTLDALREQVREEVVMPTLASGPLPGHEDARIVVNPGGLVRGGGPDLHAGLTGRKTAIDTYGEVARHSGAALSGKDPGRIDRSGAYAARYAARNVVAAGLAERCEVFLSYDIGQARPVSLGVETFGTGRMSDDGIAQRLQRAIDFRPEAIVERLRLRSLPAEHAGRFFARLAAYGQMGRDDVEAPWDRTDLTGALS
jgi:S-adenosylmethionine synthetase